MEPLFVTEEWWVSTSPDFGSMTSMKAHLAEFCEKPMQWRMHPMAYANLMGRIHDQSLRNYRNYTGAMEMLGAPVIQDVTVEPSQCKVLIRAKAHSFIVEGRAAQGKESRDDA